MEADMKRFLFVLMTVAVAFAACGDDGDKICADANCLKGALQNASSGSTVRVEAGILEGNVVVPAGVTLRGAGADSTILKSSGAGPVLEVTADGSGTSIRDLSVEGGKDGGIKVTGTGELSLSDLSVSVTGGIAVEVEGVDLLSAERLYLSGNVTEEVKDGIPPERENIRHALAGMTLKELGGAEFDSITVNGFASAGVFAYKTPVAWEAGELHHLVGSGFYTTGDAEVSLHNVIAHHVWGGATPFGYGIIVTDGAHLVAGGVETRDNEVAGVLFDHATGELTDAIVTGNGKRGVWIQFCDPTGAGGRAVVFSGSATSLDGNYGVAFGVFHSTGVDLRDAHVNDTQFVDHIPYGQETGPVPVADAIEAIGSDDLLFENLVIHNNLRAGVVVDGRRDEQEHDTTVTFTNVKISGAGQRGYAQQHGAASSSPEVTEESLRLADEQGGLLEVVKDLDITRIPDPENIIDIPM
jgi:hypothetical protein